MTFTIEADIGGFLIMEHRENHVNETHNLIGTTKTLEYVFRWDFVLPYHCVEKETNTENCVDPLTVPDLTEQVRFCFLNLQERKEVIVVQNNYFANVLELNINLQNYSKVKRYH